MKPNQLIIRRKSSNLVLLYLIAASVTSVAPASPITAPSQAASAKPDHLVIGYVPYWRDDVANPTDMNFGAFTHLIRAFLRPQPDGSLKIDSAYFNPSFESAARAHGVKLLMSVGGQASTPDVWLAIARDPQHVQKFLDTLAELYAAHQYDGVDIDWEPPPQNAADGQTYADLLHSIRSQFPNRLLTIAVEGSNYGVGHVPMQSVVADVDYINAMTYDFSGAWTGIASFGGNLHPDASGIARTRMSVDEELNNLINVHRVPAAKLVVGTRFWANRFRVDQLGDSFPAHAKGFADDLEYSRVTDLLASGRYDAFRDATADAAYLVRRDGGCVVTYDDPQAIHDKCETVKKLNCAGIMIWHASADLGGGETPLLSSVAESFGMAPLPLSRAALESEIVRLSHHPVSHSATLDELQKQDADLRSHRGDHDDGNWIAAKSVTTQPLTKN
jgi:chitinase